MQLYEGLCSFLRLISLNFQTNMKAIYSAVLNYLKYFMYSITVLSFIFIVFLVVCLDSNCIVYVSLYLFNNFLI